MQVFVRSGTTHVLDVVDGQTVADVRTFISQAEDLPLAEVGYYYYYPYDMQNLGFFPILHSNIYFYW